METTLFSFLFFILGILHIGKISKGSVKGKPNSMPPNQKTPQMEMCVYLYNWNDLIGAMKQLMGHSLTLFKDFACVYSLFFEIIVWLMYICQLISIKPPFLVAWNQKFPTKCHIKNLSPKLFDYFKKHHFFEFLFNVVAKYC